MRYLLHIILLNFGLALADNAIAGFTASYGPPRTAQEVVIADDLRRNQALEKLTSKINRIVSIAGEVNVVARSCGQPNAFYYSSKREISICYELLADHLKRLQRKYPTKSIQQLRHVIASELAYILLHEVGHAVIDLNNIPVFGKEEDAADQFAIYVLLTTDGEKVVLDIPTFMPLLNTFDRLLDRFVNSSSAYADVHALTEQRLANMICWGFGKDSQLFHAAAMAIKLPQHRADGCPREYAKMDRDIRTLLGSSLVGNNSSSIASVGSTAPSVVSTTSADAGNADHLFTQHRCTACHNMDSPHIGPSLRAIASRYRGSGAEAQLVQNVLNGSAGNWGPVPAPPQKSTPQSDVEVMVRWIVAL